MDGENYNTFNYVYYYVSTPLVISVMLGNEFRLTNGLFLNLGLGYTARAVKVRLKSWNFYSEEPPSDVSKPHQMSDVRWFHTLDLNIGLNYVFPIKNKK